MKMVKAVMIAGMAVMAAAALASCGNTVEPKQEAKLDLDAIANAAAAKVEEKQPAQTAAPVQVVMPETKSEETKAPENSSTVVYVYADDNNTYSAPAAQPRQVVPAAQPQTTQPQNTAPQQDNTKQDASKKDNAKQDSKKSSPEYTAVAVDANAFVGSYVEQSQGVANMQISENGDGTFSIHIGWAVNANEENTWDMTGIFDGKGTLNYTNCRKTTSAYDKNGNYTVGVDGIQTPFTTYTAGAGSMVMTSYGIVWEDGMGDIFKGTTFVNKKSAAAPAKNDTKPADNSDKTDKNGKHPGESGYRYYDNEPDTPAAELPTGWFTDGNGSGASMSIAKNGANYSFVVSVPDSKGGYNTYSFSGKYGNGKVTYTAGQQDYIVYNANGTVKSAKYVSGGHKGSVTNGNTGLVWEDGKNSFVFISSAMIK